MHCTSQGTTEKESEMNNDLKLNQADELGLLLAQIADLQVRADAIKDEMKDAASIGGPTVIEGELFKATYSESNATLFDGKKFIKECGQAMYDKYTKTSARFSIRVTSR
jgi:hypothetical protein